jgi:hypothetical protein
VGDALGRILSAAAILVLCGVASACARPLGDFGRAQNSVLHDEVMPTVGKARASISGEPVSAFNLTDQETEMHDRVWRFLVAPHADDWFMDTAVELQRTRIVGAADRNFREDRYYQWLHRSQYNSSRIRFRTVGDDARTDAGTAPETFRSICAVIEIDRRRSVASSELGGLSADDVTARRAENDMFIGWFTRALRYRYESYQYAIDHLLVETPHEEAVAADEHTGRLAYYVVRAESRDFCSRDIFDLEDHSKAVPSRVLRNDDAGASIRK